MRRLALVLALCLLALPALAQLSLLGLQNRMVQFLLAQISTEGVFVVTAQTVTEPEEGVTAIEGLAISDAGGVWLTAERVAFAWNASRLLSGEIDFSRLSLQGVAVLRQPGTRVAAAGQVAAADPPPFSWPRSPLTLRVAALQLTDIALAAPVLGHAIRLNATGAVQDEGAIQALRLDITRTDQVQGRIALDYRRDFAANTLALTLDAAEAPAGLVAALAGLADTVPVRARITAAGPPRDWRAEVDIAADGAIALQGRMGLAYEGPFRLDTDLALTPGPLLSDSLRAVLGTQARLIARADEADGTITIHDARLTSPELTAQAQGTYARTTGAADLAVDLTARPGLARLVPGVGFGGAGFIGWVQGTPQDLTARGDITLQGLVTAPVDAAALALTAIVTRKGTVLGFDVTGSADGLRLDRLAPERIGPARLALVGELTGTALSLREARLVSVPLTIQAVAQADIATTDAVARVTLSAPDLAPLAAAYGLEAAGRITAQAVAARTGNATVADVTATLGGFQHPLAAARDLTLTARIDQAADLGFDLTALATGLRLDRLGPELLGQTRLALQGRLAGDQLSLADFTLAAAPGTLTARGGADLAGGPVTLDYTLAAPDLAPLAAAYDLPARGGITATGHLSGTAAAPGLKGRAALTGAAWAGTGYGEVTLDHDVTLAPEPGGRIALAATGSPYGPATVATRFQMAAPMLRLDDLALTALGLSGTGAAALDLDTRLATGKLALKGPLAGLGRLAGTPLTGSATADLTLTAPKGRQDAALRLRGKGVGTPDATAGALTLDAKLTDALGQPGLTATARADNIAAGGARIARADLDATVTDLTGTPRVKAGATAGPVTLDSARLDTLALAADGPLSALDITLQTTGTASEKPLSLDLAARIDAATPKIRATIARLTAEGMGEGLRLAQPLQITAQGAAVALTGLDLRRDGGGGLGGSLASHGNGLSGDLTLTALPATLARSLAGLPLRGGRLDGTARFDTRKRGAGAAVRLTARGLGFEQTIGQGDIGADLTLDWDGTQARAALDLTGDFGEPIRARASAPLVASGTALPRLPGKAEITGALTWRGRIDRFWALVPAPAHVLMGDLDVDLTFAGTPAAPRVAGTIALAKGRYENLDTGTILTDLTVGSSLTGDGGIRLDVQAGDGGKGTVRASALVSPGAQGVDVGAQIARAVLVRRDDATARLSGQLALKGPLDALALTGGLTIDEAEVRLVANGAPGIVDLGPVRFTDDPPEPAAKPATGTLALDLTIRAPGRIFVRGRGLDSEWQADLAVRGDAAAPRITGRIEKRQGRLDLIGRAFTLKRGEVVFDGGPRIDPRLTVILENVRTDLTGRIEVTGSASQPRLAFTSTPQVPPEEVLPRILFDKARQSLSPSEAASLAIGLATLLDGKGGTLDRVRGAVGLDSLRLEQDAAGNASVAVTKQVAPGVTVGAKQSVAGQQSAVTVEVEVFDNVTLDAEVRSDASTKVGVNWRKDF